MSLEYLPVIRSFVRVVWLAGVCAIMLTACHTQRTAGTLVAANHAGPRFVIGAPEEDESIRFSLEKFGLWSRMRQFFWPYLLGETINTARPLLLAVTDTNLTLQ